MYGKRYTKIDTKLTVCVPAEALKGAKRYAELNGTTLTRLVSAYLLRLTQDSPVGGPTPILARLTGTLAPDVTERDYHEYLDRKYGDAQDEDPG